MKPKLILFTMIIIAFQGCKQPAAVSDAPIKPAKAEAACPETYYYYNQEKIPLTQNPGFLMIGLNKGTDPETGKQALMRFKEIRKVRSEALSENSGDPYFFVELNTATCNVLPALIAKLHQAPEISFANPVFDAPAQVSQSYRFIGVTSEFLVTLKSAGNLPELEQAAAATGTVIGETLGETTYIMQADKTAEGNALEMANYFQELDFVQNAEPNFFMVLSQQVAPTPDNK